MDWAQEIFLFSLYVCPWLGQNLVVKPLLNSFAHTLQCFTLCVPSFTALFLLCLFLDCSLGVGSVFLANFRFNSLFSSSNAFISCKIFIIFE